MARESRSEKLLVEKESCGMGTATKLAKECGYRVVRKPEFEVEAWGDYEILDPNGRVVEREYDLALALEAARRKNERLRARHAA